MKVLSQGYEFLPHICIYIYIYLGFWMIWFTKLFKTNKVNFKDRKTQIETTLGFPEIWDNNQNVRLDKCSRNTKKEILTQDDLHEAYIKGYLVVAYG
jgi:predicted membrane protein